MLYAEVIVATRTDTQELTYAVSAKIIPYIRLGSLVIAPLRRKTVRGVVVGLKRTVPSQLRQKIRELVDIERSSSISEESIDVIRSLADYYGASIAEVAYHALSNRQANISGSGDIKTGITRYIQAPLRTRFEEYLSIVTKHRGQILIIFSQQTFLKEFQKLLEKLPTIVKSRCVVVTLAGAFTPLPPGSVIIVDQPYHIGGKSARRPFMCSRTIGQIRSRIEGHSLIFGNAVLALENVLSVSEGKAGLVSILPSTIPFTVVKQTNFRGVGESTIAEIEEYLSKRKKILVISSSNSWAPALFCTKCEQTIECPRCSRAIGLSSPESLLCQHCGYTQDRFTLCPICQNQTVVEIGFGVKQLIKSLQQTFPDISIVDESASSINDAQIVVATEKYFSQPGQPYDLAVLVGWDRLVSGVTPEGSWRLLNYIVELQDRVGSVFVETLFPENELWGFVSAEKLRDYFQRELSERRQLSLPPYGQIIHIVGVGQAKSILEQSRQLTELLENRGFSINSSLPSSRSKNFQITLTVYNPKKINSKQKSEIKQLLQPSWHLDVDSAL